MNPKIPDFLVETAGLVVRSLAPGGDPAEVASNLGLTAALLGFAAQRWDGAAASLVEENRAIRPLLARGAQVLADEEPFAERWQALSQGADEDLRISALERANAELRGALICLHELVELAEGEAARELDAAIWAELRASTERRAVAGAPV